MLRLFIHLNHNYLKARPALPHESFKFPCNWEDEIEFEVTDSADFMMAWPSMIPDLPAKKAQSLLRLVGYRYPFSPQYEKVKKICPKLAYTDQKEEWIFFGGSFNPWHLGHQACLDFIGSEKTCFVIPDRNPHKALRSIDPVTTILDLSKRVRLKDGQYLAPSFILEEKKNPTIYWIENLSLNFPHKKLSLLMGFDSFKQIDSWIEAQKLISLIHKIYVVSRLESDSEREFPLAKVKMLSPHVNVDFLGRHKHESLSSTKLRQKI